MFSLFWKITWLQYCIERRQRRVGSLRVGWRRWFLWNLSVPFPGVSSVFCVTVHVACPKILTSEKMPELILPRDSGEQGESKDLVLFHPFLSLNPPCWWQQLSLVHHHACLWESVLFSMCLWKGGREGGRKEGQDPNCDWATFLIELWLPNSLPYRYYLYLIVQMFCF